MAPQIIGVIGGTGPEGRGLALRFALAGERVIIGSRDQRRGVEAAAGIAGLVAAGSVGGASNREAALKADIVLVAVPYGGHRDTLTSLSGELGGKIVVDVVAPLAFSNGQAQAIRVPEGSVALEAQSILPDSRVVAAFQTVSAKELLVPDRSIDSDVVVAADDAVAKRTVMVLAEKITGIRSVDGGGLANARYIEDFTALLLNINRIYKANSMLKIVGI